MTLGDLIALFWRQRVVAAVLLVMTAGALFLVSSPVEAWNGRVSVVLLVPADTPGNPLARTTQSLIATTGIVARMVDGPDDSAETVSSDLNLASTDAEPGWSVRQPRVGGQWEARYEEPRLDVKAWGRTPDEAAAQMSRALERINSSLALLQEARGVTQSQRIRVTQSPNQPVYTIQSGSRVRALAGTGLVGLVATLGALIGVDKLSRRRHELIDAGATEIVASDELAASGR